MSFLNKKTALISTALLVLILCLWGWLMHQKTHPSTDNAYVNANVINLATQVTGIVAKVQIKNQQFVKKNQILFQLDSAPFTIAVQKAQAKLKDTINAVHAQESAVKASQATLEEQQARLINTEKDTQRTLKLVQQKLASQSEGDLAVSNLKVAKATVKTAQHQLQQAQAQLGDQGDAQIKTAQADLANAQLDLKHTTLRASHSGFIENFSLRKGSEVTAYLPICALIEDDQWWVDANYKETQLEPIRPGQVATITLDLYPGKSFRGVVETISHGSGTSFALVPTENASGNWVKVTQRFPVRIKIIAPSQQTPLRIGASADVTINTKKIA
jgi:membrane fusion protein (multidrug efflux system)